MQQAETTFGAWLRHQRRRADLTQAELATRLGYSVVTIRKIERDELRPSKQFAERLAKCLTIPPEEVARFLAYARMAPDFNPVNGNAAPNGKPLPLLSAGSTTHADWGEAPDVRHFYGRAQELAQLRSWLISEGCRLAVILGLGGIGKTSLATKLAQIVQGQFEFVIWRSLRNAPPAEEILDEILRVLDPGAALDPVPMLDRQLKRLLEHLRRRRCLVILDNFEAILAEGERAGTYRAGYSGYGDLLKRVHESSHKSCLLVTSRENPIEPGAQAGADTPLRVVYLSSLAPEDSRALLAAKGLSGQSESWATLSARYSGNPLVLQVVGEAIRELFQGNLDNFLRYETTLFGGIRDLLARQFVRLSPLEQGVLLWLGVHREPVGPEVLRDELEPAPTWTALLDALQSLRRRSLVEQSEYGFTLQNVVLEFATDYLVEQIAGEITVLQPHLFQRYALLQTQARQYVRDSQTRLLIKPVVDQLVATLGRANVETHLSALRTVLRSSQAHQSGYGAGNALNLLVHLNGHLRGQDFSGFTIRQAALQGIPAQDVNLRGSHLDQCDFSIAFNAVVAVAFSAVGGYLAIGSDAGLHWLQRVQDDYPLHRFVDPGSSVWSACFSPDGNQVAAAGSDCIIRIWATKTGRRLHTLVGHTAPVWAVCFHPDGRLLASGGADCSIRIWDVQSGQCLATLEEQRNGIRGLCFSPSGALLASAGEDGTVRLWTCPPQSEEMQCMHILRGHSGMAWSVDFSPDGALIASGGHDRTIRLWHAQSGRPLMTLVGHSHYVMRVCFSPDGSLLASGSCDGTVRLWDTATGRCARTLQGHTDRVLSVAFSPDGNVLASGSADLSVRLWDVDPAVGAGQCLRTLRGYTNTTRSVKFSPDGALLASGGQDSLLRLWDVQTGKCLTSLSGSTGSIWHVNFSPDGRLLASAGPDPIIRLWDVESKRCVHEIQTTAGCNATSFHPTGAVLATANLDRTIDVWDVRDWRLLATLRGHTGEVLSVAFSADGELLASGSMDYSVRLWHWRSGQCLATLRGHTSYVSAVAFRPDGTLLASSSWDGTVQLWAVSYPTAQASAVATLTDAGDGPQRFVAFSPDGNILAIASRMGPISLWDVNAALAGGSPLCILEEHTAAVFALDFRPDGRILASGSVDGTIRLWDVSDVHRGVACIQVLQIERPYERMDITGVTGLTQAQITSLQALGAVEAA